MKLLELFNQTGLGKLWRKYMGQYPKRYEVYLVGAVLWIVL